MIKFKLFLKYLAISTVAANIPWVIVGMIFGWPAILMISLTLTFLDYVIYELNKAEMFLFTLFVGFMANVINNVGFNIYASVPLTSLTTVLVAIPSIFVGSVLVTLFHSPKASCTCPIH